MGRDGKTVEVIFKDESKIDTNAARLKQWTPNTHPNASAGALQKVKFENSLPGSKGYKSTPTQRELIRVTITYQIAGEQQTKDRNHGPHWEARTPKQVGQQDPLGRDRLQNGKSKSNYNE